MTQTAEPDSAAVPDDCDFTRPVRVEPREGFTLWVEFADGTNGRADLSFLADGPAFEGWRDRPFFESVRIEGDGVIWGNDLRRSGYSLYIDVTGLPWQEVWSRLGRESALV